MKHYDFALGRQAAGWTLIAAIALGATALAPEPGHGSAAAATPAIPVAPVGRVAQAVPVARAAEAGVRFTDLPAGDVTATIARAAEATGASHPYLLSTAKRESRLDPTAAASNSSAQGLFQFVDATWLEMIDRHGAKYGLAREAALVEVDADGEPRVDDPAERRRILDLRTDPRVSALMAGQLARDNADKLRERLDRAPTDRELYLAHFLGPRDAARLIAAAASQPGRAASDLCPRAARSNRSVFYRGAEARTAAEVVRRLA